MTGLSPLVKRFASRPIAVRLAVSSVFWSFVILLIAGLILSTLYRDNTERAFDQRLLVYANTLASNLVGPGDPDSCAHWRIRQADLADGTPPVSTVKGLRCPDCPHGCAAPPSTDATAGRRWSSGGSSR